MPADEAQEARHDAEALADVDAKRVVPHDRVRDWLSRLAKGERTPPPAA